MPGCNTNAMVTRWPTICRSSRGLEPSPITPLATGARPEVERAFEPPPVLAVDVSEEYSPQDGIWPGMHMINFDGRLAVPEPIQAAQWTDGRPSAPREKRHPPGLRRQHRPQRRLRSLHRSRQGQSQAELAPPPPAPPPPTPPPPPAPPAPTPAVAPARPAPQPPAPPAPTPVRCLRGRNRNRRLHQRPRPPRRPRAGTATAGSTSAHAHCGAAG